MGEYFSVYAVTAGVILLAAVLSSNLVYKQHLLVALQILVSFVWASTFAIHCWGAGLRICRLGLGLQDVSLPLLSVFVFAGLFVIALVPGWLLIRWFAKRLPEPKATPPVVIAWSRSACAVASGVTAALILTMNAALFLPGELSTPVPETARALARLPLRVYLSWSGNWAYRHDPPASFADYLNRWLSQDHHEPGAGDQSAYTRESDTPLPPV